MFWTVLFPIILSTLFHFAFGGLNENPAIESVSVAYVGGESTDESLLAAMEETGLFTIEKLSLTEATEKLSSGEVLGIIENSAGIKMTVAKNGIEESVIKAFLDTYKQLSATMKSVITENPEILTNGVLEKLEFGNSHTENKNAISGNIYITNFYALLAMAALMSGTGAVADLADIQANSSPVGIRANIAPTSKLVLYTAYALATAVFYCVYMLVAIAYITFVLSVPIGNIGLVILICMLGTIMGLSMGSAIFFAIRTKSEGAKIGLTIGAGLFSCFFAGLQSPSIKYLAEKAFPPLRYINPATLITDGLTALYIYPTQEKFWINIVIITGVSVILTAITVLCVRRQSYASL